MFFTSCKFILVVNRTFVPLNKRNIQQYNSGGL